MRKPLLQDVLLRFRYADDRPDVVAWWSVEKAQRMLDTYTLDRWYDGGMIYVSRVEGAPPQSPIHHRTP